MEMSVLQISKVLKEYLFASKEAETMMCTSCTWDSRNVVPGSVYFAFIGKNVDGSEFVEKAFKAGATLAIVQKTTRENILNAAKHAACSHNRSLIIVEDTLLALQRLANFWTTELGAKIIGVTGSVGKTSTKNFVATVLAEKFKIVANEGNKNNEIGMPATVLSADKGTEVLVLEMGMYNRGEIARLCEIAKPNIALITCVEDCHIESCGSRENVAKAKSEIFESLCAGDIALICNDCNFHDLVLQHSGVSKSKVRLIDITDSNYVKNMTPDTFQRMSFDFDFEGTGNYVHCQLKTPGIYNVKNAVFAGVIAVQLGMTNNEIKRGLENCESESGRMQILENKEKNLVIVNDAYNANPQSMSQGIKALDKIEYLGQKIVVLGSMLELGTKEIEMHQNIGKILMSSPSVTKYILIGELGSHIADNFSKEELENTIICTDANSAKTKLNEMQLSNCLLYFKASNSVGLDELANDIYCER